MSRTSALTRTDQKFGSLARSRRGKCRPRPLASSCRSKAVVLTAFCSVPLNRARLAVKVSAMRNSTLRPSLAYNFRYMLDEPLGGIDRGARAFERHGCVRPQFIIGDVLQIVGLRQEA